MALLLNKPTPPRETVGGTKKMVVLAYDSEVGKVVDAGNLTQVNYLLGAKKTKPFWEVVEEAVKMWGKKEVSNWESYIIHLKGVKADQKRTRVGTKTFRGVSRKDGIERSLVIDFPVWIHLLLKKLYPEESDYLNSKEFFRSMADKFPIFKIREKE